MQTEFLTQKGRRIDVLLMLDKFWIGIENKTMGAAEQQGQCQDYAEELERLSGGRWLLVFLTAERAAPITCGRYNGDVRIKSHTIREFAEMLLVIRCKRTEAFLTDFQRYIRERIYGEEPPFIPAESKMIDEFLLPTNIDVTLEILKWKRAIHRTALKRFKEGMLSRVCDRFDMSWCAEIFSEKMQTAADFDEKNSALLFFKDTWKGQFAIGFSNQKACAKAVLLGIYYWPKVGAAPRICADCGS